MPSMGATICPYLHHLILSVDVDLQLAQRLRRCAVRHSRWLSWHGRKPSAAAAFPGWGAPPPLGPAPAPDRTLQGAASATRRRGPRDSPGPAARLNFAEGTAGPSGGPLPAALWPRMAGPWPQPLPLRWGVLADSGRQWHWRMTLLALRLCWPTGICFRPPTRARAHLAVTRAELIRRRC